MRKPIIDAAHLKSKILLCIYIFRSLPVLYIETINSYKREMKEKARLIINNLLQDNVIKKSLADNGSIYLRLTLNGYTFVSQYLLPQASKPLYSYKRETGINHKISDHDYYNFVFVWDFISKNPRLLNKNIQIYDDSNLNQCKLSFFYENKKIVVSPDILIFQPDEKNSLFKKAIFIENDLGSETYKMLFEKIVEYGLLLESGIQQNSISDATIYFIFHSEIRTVQLLFGEKSILQFFDYVNFTKKVKRIPIDSLLKAYSKNKIYYSFYNKENLFIPLSFSEYSLTSLLLERRPEWKIYF